MTIDDMKTIMVIKILFQEIEDNKKISELMKNFLIALILRYNYYGNIDEFKKTLNEEFGVKSGTLILSFIQNISDVKEYAVNDVVSMVNDIIRVVDGTNKSIFCKFPYLSIFLNEIPVADGLEIFKEIVKINLESNFMKNNILASSDEKIAQDASIVMRKLIEAYRGLKDNLFIDSKHLNKDNIDEVRSSLSELGCQGNFIKKVINHLKGKSNVYVEGDGLDSNMAFFSIGFLWGKLSKLASEIACGNYLVDDHIVEQLEEVINQLFNLYKEELSGDKSFIFDKWQELSECLNMFNDYFDEEKFRIVMGIINRNISVVDSKDSNDIDDICSDKKIDEAYNNIKKLYIDISGAGSFDIKSICKNLKVLGLDDRLLKVVERGLALKIKYSKRTAKTVKKKDGTRVEESKKVAIPAPNNIGEKVGVPDLKAVFYSKVNLNKLEPRDKDRFISLDEKIELASWVLWLGRTNDDVLKFLKNCDECNKKYLSSVSEYITPYDLYVSDCDKLAYYASENNLEAEFGDLEEYFKMAYRPTLVDKDGTLVLDDSPGWRLVFNEAYYDFVGLIPNDGFGYELQEAKKLCLVKQQKNKR